MKIYNKLLCQRTSVVLLIILLMAFLACEHLNPTKVTNPLTTDEDLKNNSDGSTVVFLNGLVEICSNAIENCASFNESVSDNYDNTGGERRPHWDSPREISPAPNLVDVGGYHELHQLRSQAIFILETVIPNDKNATSEHKAEALFYRGLAGMLLGEWYVGSSIEENGSALTPEELLNLALADFDAALEVSGQSEFATRIYLAKARTYRMLGDVTNALANADLALNAGPADFIFTSVFDMLNNGNFFAYLDSWQPNPRLDFLDPKFPDLNSEIPILKMEEAYLIKAEGQLSNADFGGARQTMADLIAFVETRPVQTFTDPDPRPDDIQRNFGGSRPQIGKVKFDADSPEIDGLILPRNGATVSIPVVSGTHFSVSDINSLEITTQQDLENLFYTLYLLRQEILFAEGRRLCDLGIRIPVSGRQLETNSNLNSGAIGTVLVPQYIPLNDEMDWFSVNSADSVVTIQWDVNKILTENRLEVSPFSMPF